jgi:hypothetical protein
LTSTAHPTWLLLLLLLLPDDAMAGNKWHSNSIVVNLKNQFCGQFDRQMVHDPQLVTSPYVYVFILVFSLVMAF